MALAALIRGKSTNQGENKGKQSQEIVHNCENAHIINFSFKSKSKLLNYDAWIAELPSPEQVSNLLSNGFEGLLVFNLCSSTATVMTDLQTEGQPVSPLPPKYNPDMKAGCDWELISKGGFLAVTSPGWCCNYSHVLRWSSIKKVHSNTRIRTTLFCSYGYSQKKLREVTADAFLPHKDRRLHRNS